MIGSAIGPVISFAITMSNFASISCPASTWSRPACAASIFCVIVIPITTTSSFLLSLTGYFNTDKYRGARKNQEEHKKRQVLGISGLDRWRLHCHLLNFRLRLWPWFRLRLRFWFRLGLRFRLRFWLRHLYNLPVLFLIRIIRPDYYFIFDLFPDQSFVRDHYLIFHRIFLPQVCTLQKFTGMNGKTIAGHLNDCIFDDILSCIQEDH